MTIEIEWHELGMKAGEPGFLFRLAQGNQRKIHITVSVATQLQPTAQLTVMGQQDTFAIGTDQPCRTGEMPLKGFTQKHLLTARQKIDEMRNIALVGPLLAVVLKL